MVKSKLLQKYCPAAIGMDFSKKFLLGTNLQNNDQISLRKNSDKGVL